jgi:hypothetical protein
MKPRFGQERGQDLVEYALILPLFLFLVFMVIELSVLYFSYVTISNAAREGARSASTVAASASCNLSCIEDLADSAARGLTTGLNDDDLEIAVTHLELAGSPSIQVQVCYRAHLLTKMLIEALGGQSYIDMSATSTMVRAG